MAPLLLFELTNFTLGERCSGAWCMDAPIDRQCLLKGRYEKASYGCVCPSLEAAACEPSGSGVHVSMRLSAMSVISFSYRYGKLAHL